MRIGLNLLARCQYLYIFEDRLGEHFAGLAAGSWLSGQQDIDARSGSYKSRHGDDVVNSNRDGTHPGWDNRAHTSARPNGRQPASENDFIPKSGVENRTTNRLLDLEKGLFGRLTNYPIGEPQILLRQLSANLEILGRHYDPQDRRARPHGAAIQLLH